MSPAPFRPSVRLERVMAYAPDRIWRALTERSLIEQWLMKNDFEPLVGHRFQLHATPLPYWNGVADCQVLLVEPPHRLIYSWNASDREAARGPKTVVTITLAPLDTGASAAGTRLWLQQAGFRVEEGGRYQEARIHWQQFLERLEGVVAGL